MSNEAIKHDTDKLPMELLPVEALEGVADVLRFGAGKYAAHNWRHGMDWGRLIGASLRHIFAFMHGEDKDPETGLSHIDHALCCLLFLSTYIKTNTGNDNRWKPEHD